MFNNSDLFWQKLNASRGEMQTAQAVEQLLTSGPGIEVTSELLEEIVRRFGRDTFAEWSTLPEIARFVAELAAMRQSRSVLDPMCGTGLLLNAVAQRAAIQTIHGADINETAAAIASKLLGPAAEIIRSDAFTSLQEFNSEYDLVVCEPPFGARLRNPFLVDANQAGAKLQYSDEAAICFACSRLAPGGAAILLVRSALVWSDRPKSARALTDLLGCAIRACIQVPCGTLLKTSIETYLLLIERGNPGPVFVGQFTTNVQHQKVLLENFSKGQPGVHAAQGRIIDWCAFRGFRAIDALERLRLMAKRLGFEEIPMHTLVAAVQKTNKVKFSPLSENPNSLAIAGRVKLFFA